MIRQARTYLAGAVSGTALIVVAIVGFVLLVSLQAFERWPFAGAAGGQETNPGGSLSAPAPRAAAAADSRAATGAGTSHRPRSVTRGGGAATGVQADTVSGPAIHRSPATPTSGDAVPAGESAAGGGGGSGGEPPPGGGSGSSLARTVAGTVNDTVAGVGNALGGALGESGVGEATEGAVNGVTGVAGAGGGAGNGVTAPGSSTAAGAGTTVEAVGGLLDGGN